MICTWVVGFGVALVAIAAVSAQNPGGSEEGKKIKNPVPSSADSVAAGQAAFTKNCRFCHGADAKGNGPMAPKDTHPSDLTDTKWDRGSTDGEIFIVLRDGHVVADGTVSSDMPVGYKLNGNRRR